MKNLFSLTGKTAFITGASSGIGRHFAITLAKAGANVVITGRRINLLNEVAAEIEQAGAKVKVLELDVTKTASVNQAVAQATRDQDIQILVNCAGNAVRKNFLEFTESDWNSIIDTHVKGTWLVSQAISKHMIDRKQSGSIINISSTLGTRTRANGFAYCTAKAAIEQLTRSLALDLIAYNIRTNLIAPGWFVTDLNRDFLNTPEGKHFLDRVPMKRTGNFNELEGALLLLASDASSYMTGSTIQIDGGYACNEV